MANLVPWATLAVLCAAAAASCRQDATNVVAFLGCSIALLTGVWLLWRGLLWPVYFSPLRHLPTVPVGSRVFSKETLRLYTEPRGVPQCDWYVISAPLAALIMAVLCSPGLHLSIAG